MPLEIAYPDNGQGIKICALGYIEPSEILEAYKEIYSEKHIKKKKYFLIDRSECMENYMTNEGIREIAAHDNYALKVNPNLIIAHITPTDFQYGLTRIWLANMDDDQFSIRIFRERKSAEAWIKNKLKNN